MSEKMYPIPFKSLMNWVVTEYANCGEIFGVRKAYHATGKSLPIFGERIETPFGPAAGPNSQLAQNIIAAYMAGARFFEVKTVQKMDGADLAACVPRPCILANDEGYNQEWSTELTVPQAMDEYIKAWCALKVLSKVYGFGDPNGFVFNMSVGYDLEGIKGEKVNTYIEGMKDANKTAIFGECKAVLKELFPEESDYIDAIDPRVSRSVTVSTLHGCPPDEIERIASYLITEKHLHTFVKCNPTILGYETARRVLDGVSNRTARWYYLSSLANQGLGNSIGALQDARRAVQLDPNNTEYQMHLRRMQNPGQTYRTQTTYAQPGGLMRWCWSMILLNLLCNCCCGGGWGWRFRGI